MSKLLSYAKNAGGFSPSNLFENINENWKGLEYLKSGFYVKGTNNKKHLPLGVYVTPSNSTVIETNGGLIFSWDSIISKTPFKLLDSNKFKPCRGKFGVTDWDNSTISIANMYLPLDASHSYFWTNRRNHKDCFCDNNQVRYDLKV